jgi:hypothetical protein
MPVILNRLPISERDTVAFVGAEQIRLRADQIIVWVSLAVRDVLSGTAEMRRFPALLDTGMNHFFALQERHLTQWAELALNQLDIVGHIRERGQTLSLYAASLFVYPNKAGNIELAEQISFRLSIPRGIIVYPNAGLPRLPLLGLRTNVHNRLRLLISGDQRTVTLRTPRMLWPFF